jgi:hypothetical protein
MRRVLLPALLLAGATTVMAGTHNHRGNRTVSFDDFDNGATDCSAMRVQFDGERAPVVSENVPLGNIRSLRVRSGQNGGIRVVGTRTGGYTVTACKAAALSSDASQVRINVNGDEVTASGPDSDNWVVYFIVQTPRNATLDVTSSNGPIGVYEFDGTLTARAQNGPLGIKDSTGTIDASTVNGPISIDGGSGNVKLSATNGPLAVKLDGTSWLGGSLDASTQNGPLSLKLPRSYRSGVVVESLGHGPVSCRAEGCAAARMRETDDEDNDRPRRIELGSGSSNVHLSTVNGPISVKDME